MNNYYTKEHTCTIIFCLKKDIKHYPFETTAWWTAGEIMWTFSLAGSGWKHPISCKKETKRKKMYKWMRGNCCFVIGLFGLFLKGTKALQKPPAFVLQYFTF